MKTKIAAALFLLTTSSLTQAGFLSDLSKALETTNQILNPSTSPSKQIQSNPKIQTPTDAQINKIANIAKTKSGDPKIDKVIAEAAPNIGKLMLAATCTDTTVYLERYIGTIIHPEANTSFMFGLGFPNYHPKDKCMTAQRIGGWKMPANNAIKFIIIYISEDSGESVTRYVEMIKHQNEWLVMSHWSGPV